MVSFAELSVAIIGIVGIVATFNAVKTFRIIYWKRALYFIFMGLVVFEIYQLVLGFDWTEAEVVLTVLELEFMGFIVVGIAMLRETAKKVGA